MRKTITYTSFVIATLVVVLAFVTARTYTQLALATILYPLLVYFAFKIFPRKTWKAPVFTVRLPVRSTEKVVAETIKPKAQPVEVADIDKRAFLKLIGAAGLSFFLFSLIGRKTGALPFGGASGTGITALEDVAGNKINPAQAQPTDGYRISEIDDNAITFYGFTNKDGAWFIMKEDTDTGSFRYSRGDTNFSGNWSNRENLGYDYYSNVF